MAVFVEVDDIANGLRAATLDEADERNSFERSLLDRIKLLTDPVNRVAAYQAAPAILCAMRNFDKPGAKANVDTLTQFALAARTKLKALIDLA